MSSPDSADSSDSTTRMPAPLSASSSLPHRAHEQHATRASSVDPSSAAQREAPRDLKAQHRPRADLPQNFNAPELSSRQMCPTPREPRSSSACADVPEQNGRQRSKGQGNHADSEPGLARQVRGSLTSSLGRTPSSPRPVPGSSDSRPAANQQRATTPGPTIAAAPVLSPSACPRSSLEACIPGLEQSLQAADREAKRVNELFNAVCKGAGVSTDEGLGDLAFTSTQLRLRRQVLDAEKRVRNVAGSLALARVKCGKYLLPIEKVYYCVNASSKSIQGPYTAAQLRKLLELGIMPMDCTVLVDAGVFPGGTSFHLTPSQLLPLLQDPQKVGHQAQAQKLVQQEPEVSVCGTDVLPPPRRPCSAEQSEGDVFVPNRDAIDAARNRPAGKGTQVESGNQQQAQPQGGRRPEGKVDQPTSREDGKVREVVEQMERKRRKERAVRQAFKARSKQNPARFERCNHFYEGQWPSAEDEDACAEGQSLMEEEIYTYEDGEGFICGPYSALELQAMKARKEIAPDLPIMYETLVNTAVATVDEILSDIDRLKRAARSAARPARRAETPPPRPPVSDASLGDASGWGASAATPASSSILAHRRAGASGEYGESAFRSATLDQSASVSVRSLATLDTRGSSEVAGGPLPTPSPRRDGRMRRSGGMESDYALDSGTVGYSAGDEGYSGCEAPSTVTSTGSRRKRRWDVCGARDGGSTPRNVSWAPEWQPGAREPGSHAYWTSARLGGGGRAHKAPTPATYWPAAAEARTLPDASLDLSPSTAAMAGIGADARAATCMPMTQAPGPEAQWDHHQVACQYDALRLMGDAHGAQQLACVSQGPVLGHMGGGDWRAAQMECGHGAAMVDGMPAYSGAMPAAPHSVGQHQLQGMQSVSAAQAAVADAAMMQQPYGGVAADWGQARPAYDDLHRVYTTSAAMASAPLGGGVPNLLEPPAAPNTRFQLFSARGAVGMGSVGLSAGEFGIPQAQHWRVAHGAHAGAEGTQALPALYEDGAAASHTLPCTLKGMDGFDSLEDLLHHALINQMDPMKMRLLHALGSVAPERVQRLNIVALSLLADATVNEAEAALTDYVESTDDETDPLVLFATLLHQAETRVRIRA